MTPGSLGSGTAKPDSQPPTARHSPTGIGPPVRLLDGPRDEGPSWRFPMTEYGIRSSVYTWYIWAIGSLGRSQVSPRLVETLTPPSCPTIIRSGWSGAIHMSWWSPPESFRKVVRPPSSVVVWRVARKCASSASSGAATTRV